MERAASGAGVTFRPNSSFAGVAGSLGRASGGRGSGLTEPLSWARASTAANASTAAAMAIDRITGPSTPLIRAPPRSTRGFARRGQWLFGSTVGRGAGAPCIGGGDLLVAVREQIGRRAGKREQALLDLTVRLDDCVRPHMTDVK